MSEYQAFNLVRQEMRERSDKSGQQPTYTIKPPVWNGNTTRVGPYFSACVLQNSGKWDGHFRYIKTYASSTHATEAAARAWCEQRYYEWVKQFLSEVS